jgi:hypothetical protein
MKRVKQLLIAGVLAVTVGLVAVAPQVSAINAVGDACSKTGTSSSLICNSVGKDNAVTTVKSIIDTLLFALGIVAVIMIIIGAFKYVVSGGDASSIASAKNTILYAVIGLVVAILAYTIVHFVTSNVK